MPSSTRIRLMKVLRGFYHIILPVSTRKKMRLARYVPKQLMPPPPILFPRPVTTPRAPTSLFGKLTVRPKIGVVIPTYNSLEHLKLSLGLLSWQTMKDFVVVVVDDGSTDGTRDWIRETRQEAFWSNRLTYLHGGPHRGLRLGRALNLGVANLPNDVWLIMTLDPTILLHPSAFATYLEWNSAFPNAILVGAVDWLPTMERGEVRRLIESGDYKVVAAQVDRSIPLEQVAASHVGPEYRSTLGMIWIEQLAGADTQPIQRGCIAAKNLAYPPRLHWFVGGYDEQLRGATYAEADFGERLALEGIDMVGVTGALGLHMAGDSPTTAAMIDAQRSLDYLIRKYLLHGYPSTVIEAYTAPTDWRYWWHYNRERGAEIVSPDGMLWVINGPRTHRLQLPNATWLTPLGFLPHEVHVIAPSELEAFENVGVAADPLNDGLDYLRPPKN